MSRFRLPGKTGSSSEKDPEVTDSFDLLFRGMEIKTGGQRIHDYNEQVSKMLRRDMSIGDV